MNASVNIGFQWDSTRDYGKIDRVFTLSTLSTYYMEIEKQIH